jgi:glycosyltransferase involved in cell wall biosynthesis
MANEKKVLVFVVAYNAEKTIGSVLSRIPSEKLPAHTDVLVIDDSSADATFESARQHAESTGRLNVSMISWTAGHS